MIDDTLDSDDDDASVASPKQDTPEPAKEDSVDESEPRDSSRYRATIRPDSEQQRNESSTFEAPLDVLYSSNRY